MPPPPKDSSLLPALYLFSGIAVVATIMGLSGWWSNYQEESQKKTYIKKWAEDAAKKAAIEAAKTPEQKAADAKGLALKEAAADKVKAEQAAAAAKDQAVRNSFDPILAGASTSIQMNSWQKAGFDNVMLISARITNHHSRPVKDIEVRCKTAGTSGTPLSQQSRVIYQSILSGKSITVSEFSMGFIDQQSQTASCEVGRVRVD